MKTRTVRGTTQGRPSTRVRVLRCVLLAVLLMLLMMATGCDEIFADMLVGEGCGTHDVCSKKAATAGIGATLMGLAGTYLQRLEDGVTSLWPWSDSGSEGAAPWDADESEWGLDKNLDEAEGASAVKTAKPPADSGEDGGAPWDKPRSEWGLDKNLDEAEGASAVKTAKPPADSGEEGGAPWDQA